MEKIVQRILQILANLFAPPSVLLCLGQMMLILAFGKKFHIFVDFCALCHTSANKNEWVLLFDLENTVRTTEREREGEYVNVFPLFTS